MDNLLGFKSNLPFLLSKSNHNGIHIGLMHWYYYQAWTEGGWLTDWPGGHFKRIWQEYEYFWGGFSLVPPKWLFQETSKNCTSTIHNLSYSLAQKHALTWNDCFDICRDSITMCACLLRWVSLIHFHSAGDGHTSTTLTCCSYVVMLRFIIHHCSKATTPQRSC